LLPIHNRTNVPQGFHFSQGSLQDFTDCPRRFQLRYIKQCAWPASISEPALEHERRMLQGAIFHRFVQQNLSGISGERIQEMMDEPAFAAGNADLSVWWKNYRTTDPAGVSELTSGCFRFVEVPLSIPMGSYRLTARYDLVQIIPSDLHTASRAVILDWKTSRKKERRANLAGSMQTRVYRYVLVQAGYSLHPTLLQGNPTIDRLQPEQVEMVYWFAGFPEAPERFVYTSDQYADDDRTLRALIGDITSRAEGDFPMTLVEKRCLYCVYRSLCERGICAGAFDDIEEVPEPASVDEVNIDFSQVEEIAF